MIAPLVIVRPEPGCAASLAAARAAGLEAWGFPLFDVAPVAWEVPSPAGIDALLIGSANALRHGGAALAIYRDKPAYVVGARTAQATREAGLTVAATGSGGLADALGMLSPRHRRLLRLAGRERVELPPPPGVTLIERTVYASEPRPMPAELARLLTARALPRVVVALHSGEAARHFAAECDRLAIARGRIAIATLAPRIAAAVGEGWADVGCAAGPDDTALLALAADMCQKQDRMG